MRYPDQAAHFLGKLLRYVGEDNVLWGTDCLFYGSPQPMIQALRSFKISEEFQEVNPADGQTYTVQYFERARFEWHPQNNEPYKVQLGLLTAYGMLWPDEEVHVWGIFPIRVKWLVIIIALSIAASWLPAQSASGVSVRESLVYQ